MRFGGFVRAVRICGKLLRAIEIWGVSCLFCFPALFLTITVTLQLHSGKMAGLYFFFIHPGYSGKYVYFSTVYQTGC